MEWFTLAKLLEMVLSASIETGVERLATNLPAKLRDDVEVLRNASNTEQRQHIEAALRDAVESVRQQFGGETDNLGGLIIDWLEHDTLLHELTEVLLMDRRPDPDRLRPYLRSKVSDEQWRAMRRPLLLFVCKVEEYLKADKLWGPIIAEFQQQAILGDINTSILHLDDHLATVVGHLESLPARIKSELHPVDLNETERHYLNWLYLDSNTLPLADDRPDIDRRRRTPRLEQIYVNLDTKQPPSRHLVAKRLQKLGIDLEELIKKVEQLTPSHDGQGTDRMQRHTPRNDGQDQQARSMEMLRLLDGESLQSLAETFEVEADALRLAFATATVFEAIQMKHQLVLLGDPGSGKSTLTRRLAGILAAFGCERADDNGAEWSNMFDKLFGRWLLPVRIVMSRWARRLPADATGCADDLINECVHLISRSGEYGLRQKEHFGQRLKGPEPTALILLDGMDEVTDKDKRKLLRQAVDHFCASYGNVPLIATCRVRPYTAWKKNGQGLQPVDFELEKLSPAAIEEFVARWHTELLWAGLYEAERAQTAKERLLDALKDSDRSELRKMAGTPLLLTMMARINYTKELPDDRAALYEEYVRHLLWEWERSKRGDGDESPTLDNMLYNADVSKHRFERALCELAYDVHDQHANKERLAEGAKPKDEQDTADIHEMQIRSTLEAIHPGDLRDKAIWAADVLQLIDERSGLIHKIDDQLYQFSHRTLREYLAARALSRRKGFLKRIEQKIDDEQWSETIYLTLGYLISVRSEYDQALKVFAERLPTNPQNSTEWRRALLLGEAYVRLRGPQRAREAEEEKRAQDVIANMPKILTRAMQNPDLGPRERLKAGQLLADLDKDPEGLDALIPVAGGALKIARYPVTNKQFKQFMDDDGYTNDAWWQDEKGRGYRDKNKWTEPRYWLDPECNRLTQPVVGISWYEANAYCAWQTARLRADRIIGQNEEVRLPTQEEYTQAAGSETYAWGPDFEASKVNSEESALNQATPVHMYPGGATSDGVYDLCGNVWEWSHDEHENIEGAYCLTGGAFYSNAERVQSSSRYWNFPNLWGNPVGFRYVVVPISPS